MTPSDVDLIASVLADDDRDAFGKLVQRHQSAVRNFLRHLTHGNAAMSDDLAQETFIQAYGSLRKFNGATFSTWLFGIAHNLWRNARRRQRDEVPLEEMGSESGAAAPDHAELRHDLTSAMRLLSADEQLAIHLNYQQGLSHAEIAGLLEWPIGTVKTHLARAKDKLRQILAVWNPRL